MPPHTSAGDFGARLREARERRGMPLRDIANTTRISMRALEALERNDISQLPGGLFSRSFVRAYAVQIGLDPEQTVEEFLKQFPDVDIRVGHPPSYRFGIDESEMQPPSRFVPWLVFCTVAALLVGSIAWFVLRR